MIPEANGVDSAGCDHTIRAGLGEARTARPMTAAASGVAANCAE